MSNFRPQQLCVQRLAISFRIRPMERPEAFPKQPEDGHHWPGSLFPWPITYRFDRARTSPTHVTCGQSRRPAVEPGDPKRTGKDWFWKSCKPNFVCALRRRESFIYAADTRNPSAFAELGRAVPWIPYLALHPMGFSVPRCLRFARCALTAPFHHHRRLAPEAVCFLWHCPSEHLTTFRPRVSRPNKPGLRGIAPCGVRTFLPRLAPKAILRPSKTNHTIYYPTPHLKP